MIINRSLTFHSLLRTPVELQNATEFRKTTKNHFVFFLVQKVNELSIGCRAGRCFRTDLWLKFEDISLASDKIPHVFHVLPFLTTDFRKRYECDTMNSRQWLMCAVRRAVRRNAFSIQHIIHQRMSYLPFVSFESRLCVRAYFVWVTLATLMSASVDVFTEIRVVSIKMIFFFFFWVGVCPFRATTE